MCIRDRHFGLDCPPVVGGTQADSSLIALQIIAGGTGAAIVAESFTRRYVEQRLLVSPFEYRFPLPRSFFLVLHDSAKKRREVGYFCDWLSEQHRNMAI